MASVELIFKLIICHLFGDYPLQIDYIAQTKGKNWYHLIVHCILYCVPFYYFFGLNSQLILIFISHIIIDALKARYNVISYRFDQILHYAVLSVYFVGGV